MSEAKVRAAKLHAHRLRWRRRMRRALKHLPRRSNISRYPVIRRFAGMTKLRPELWSYKSPYTTRAIYMGSIITFLPLGGIQILVSLFLCIALRANLTVAAALQFVSNPLTAAPMYVGTYQLGKWIMGLFGFQSEGWASGAAIYLTLGGLIAGLVLGLVIDISIRSISTLNKRKHRQLIQLATSLQQDIS